MGPNESTGKYDSEKNPDFLIKPYLRLVAAILLDRRLDLVPLETIRSNSRFRIEVLFFIQADFTRNTTNYYVRLVIYQTHIHSVETILVLLVGGYRLFIFFGFREDEDITNSRIGSRFGQGNTALSPFFGLINTDFANFHITRFGGADSFFVADNLD